MKCAAIAHNEIIQWQTLGYSDFVDSNFLDDINDLTGIQSANVQSPTFNREAQKHFVKVVTKEMQLSMAVVNQITKELDKAPDSKFMPVDPNQPPGGVPQEGQGVGGNGSGQNGGVPAGVTGADLKGLMGS